MGIKICPNCGTQNDASMNFCISCGSNLGFSQPAAAQNAYAGNSASGYNVNSVPNYAGNSAPNYNGNPAPNYYGSPTPSYYAPPAKSKYTALRGYSVFLKIVGIVGAIGIGISGLIVAGNQRNIRTYRTEFSVPVFLGFLLIAAIYLITWLIMAQFVTCFADIGDNTNQTNQTNLQILEELKKLNGQR